MSKEFSAACSNKSSGTTWHHPFLHPLTPSYPFHPTQILHNLFSVPRASRRQIKQLRTIIAVIPRSHSTSWCRVESAFKRKINYHIAQQIKRVVVRMGLMVFQNVQSMSWRTLCTLQRIWKWGWHFLVYTLHKRSLQYRSRPYTRLLHPQFNLKKADSKLSEATTELLIIRREDSRTQRTNLTYLNTNINLKSC